MQKQAEKGLTVREHERESVELPSEFTVTEAHAAQVQLTPASDAIGPNCIACTMVDLSSGGAGVESRHYLPRMCEGVLRVYEGSEEPEDRRLVLEEQVKVRRIEMLGRDGQYALGMAFTNRGPEMERRIDAALKRVHGEQSTEEADRA